MIRSFIFLSILAITGLVATSCWTSPVGPTTTAIQAPSATATAATAASTPSAVAQVVPATPTSVPPAFTATSIPAIATPALPTPTATASPTPTPRIKPPPSVYRRLQDYPRPANDSGYGFHINAEPYFSKKDVLQNQVIPLLNSLGARWVTVWASTGDIDEQVDLARLMVSAGFGVVLRLHELNPPHPDWLPPDGWISKYRSAGIQYFVTGNEPNLLGENPSKGGADRVARQWMISADRIKRAGGIPLLYPMSPGGGGDVADSRDMLVSMLDWLKANDALDTLDGAGVAIHNRPVENKPLEVRDSTSYLEYEWIDDTVAKYAGKHIPLFGTEAGYTWGPMHTDGNLGIINGFRDGRWRDSLFSQNFWLLGGFGYQEFIADWWVANPINYGKDLPIVEVLKAAPKFTRKFSEAGFK